MLQKFVLGYRSLFGVTEVCSGLQMFVRGVTEVCSGVTKVFLGVTEVCSVDYRSLFDGIQKFVRWITGV